MPELTESVIAGNCSTYGYTQYTCEICGYSYRDHYTLFTHTVSVWKEQEAATLETEGTEIGYCDGCGIQQTRTIPVIQPETQPTTVAPETEPQETVKPQNTPKKQNHLPLIIAIVIVVGCSVALVILLVQESKRKRRRKRKGGKFNR